MADTPATVKFTWKIDSVDETTGMMLVTYTPVDAENGNITPVQYNLNIPSAETDLTTYIENYAPLALWQKFEYPPIPVGQTGDSEVPADPTTPPTQTLITGWDTDQLKAYIYSVIREMSQQAG